MVAISGMAVTTAYGRGTRNLWDGLLSGKPEVSLVSRFDTSGRRTQHAATLPGDPELGEELSTLIEQACTQARLSVADRAETPLVLACRARPETRKFVQQLAVECGLRGVVRVHTGACSASNFAVAHAATMITTGAERQVVVAAGSLVDVGAFGAFDSAGILAPDGIARPFNADRCGPVLGDGAAALVLQAAAARPLAMVSGWGGAGDAHHVVRPHPQGRGTVLAARAAMRRAAVSSGDIGYVNPHATATPMFDASEASALQAIFGEHVLSAPVSATKALHGHCLEASGLVELAVTVLAMRAGLLPVNAGYREPDDQCRLDLVLGSPRPAQVRYALTLSAGFGGTCTALVIEAAR